MDNDGIKTLKPELEEIITADLYHLLDSKSFQTPKNATLGSSFLDHSRISSFFLISLQFLLFTHFNFFPL